MDANDKYHDAEIYSISHQDKNLVLLLSSNYTINCMGVEYWELSPFEFQNVIFELNIYNMQSLPDCLFDDYSWLVNYKDFKNFKVVAIDSSVGMYGVILSHLVEVMSEHE